MENRLSLSLNSIVGGINYYTTIRITVTLKSSSPVNMDAYITWTLLELLSC